MKKSVPAALTSLLLSSIVLAAETTPTASPPPLPAFSEVDANQNGLISREEADKYQGLKEQFARADADKDGELSPSEYQKARSSKTS